MIYPELFIRDYAMGGYVWVELKTKRHLLPDQSVKSPLTLLTSVLSRARVAR